MRVIRLLPVLACCSAFIALACQETVDPTPVDFIAEGLTFSPTERTTTATTLTMVWGFRDGPHNVTWEDATAPSANLSSGTYERNFTAAAAGTYRFRCSLHSTDFTTGMVGRVIKP